MANKPKVAFYGFTGCAGDQLAIIHCEDELLDIFGAVDVRSFLMASRETHDDEKIDVAFVEGSISTDHHLGMIKDIRKRASTLVALGSCACYGGPQAAHLGYDDWPARFKKVYGEIKHTVAKPFEAHPLDEYVKVDYYLPGCPIDKHQFFYAVTRLVQGMPVELTKFPVCAECKWNENECLLLKGELCLGPVTAGGCNSRCPNHNLACIGCWGPADEANVASEISLLKEKKFSEAEIINKLRLFGGAGMVRRFGELLGIKQEKKHHAREDSEQAVEEPKKPEKTTHAKQARKHQE